MKLIDKDALTEKLWERRIKNRDFGGSPHSEYGHEDDEILSLINSLEVKEVDLEKEIQNHIKECLDVKFPTTDVELIKKDVAYTAKKFFELGLKAQKGE